MKSLVIIATYFISFQVVAQDSLFQFPVQQKKATLKAIAFKQGHVTYKEDARVAQLVDFLTTPIPPENTTHIDGYRVQIFFNSNKNLVDEQRTKFISSYPKIRTYLHYEAPNYLLKVGNFRSKIQAAKFRNIISIEFPASIIQKIKIELPTRNEDLLELPH